MNDNQKTPNAGASPAAVRAPSDADIKEVLNALPGGDEIAPGLQQVPIAIAFARAILDHFGGAQQAGEPVAWRWVPSDVWRDYILTDNPAKAQRARELGLTVEPLYAGSAPAGGEVKS